MRPHLARRRTALLQGGVALAGSLALLLTGAAPASGGQEPGSTGYEVVWTFDGGVTTSLTERSYTFLDDLRDTSQSDRVVSKPDRGESVTIGGEACVPGNYNSSAVTLYGAANWFGGSASSPQKVRVSLMCKRPDGSQHRYRWGYAQANCVVLTRTSGIRADRIGDVLTVTPGEGCPVEHHRISSSGKVTTVDDGPLTFTSSVELLGLKQQ